MFWTRILFPQLDEPGIFGEAASVEVERDAVTLAHGALLADVFHRDRLVAAGVVGNRQHDEWNTFAASAGDESLKRGHVHVAFEGMRTGRLMTFSDDQIHCLAPHKCDVGTRAAEMPVIGDDVAFLAGYPKQDPLGGDSLVRGDEVPVAEDFLDGACEVVEALAAGVALGPFHDAGPLTRRHGTGAGVCEQINENIFGGQQEEVVISDLEELLALLAGGSANRRDTLDAEWFDDGFDGHGRAQSAFPSITNAYVMKRGDDGV